MGCPLLGTASVRPTTYYLSLQARLCTQHFGILHDSCSLPPLDKLTPCSPKHHHALLHSNLLSSAHDWSWCKFFREPQLLFCPHMSCCIGVMLANSGQQGKGDGAGSTGKIQWLCSRGEKAGQPAARPGCQQPASTSGCGHKGGLSSAAAADLLQEGIDGVSLLHLHFSRRGGGVEAVAIKDKPHLRAKEAEMGRSGQDPRPFG